MEGAHLRFTREAILTIAKQAVEMKTGAGHSARSWRLSCLMLCMTFLQLREMLRL